jgi:hypothetical protein
MRRLIVALTLVALPSAAHAEWKKVTRQDSKLLLAAPLLENGREVYEYGGWTAQGGHESSYAAIVPATGAYPRMQVYLYRLASQSYWKIGSDLDEKWLKGSFPFLKDKTVQITAPAPGSGRYLRVMRFAIGGTSCAAFEMRHLDPTGSAKTDEYRNSVSGLYCASPDTALTDELVQQATEGVYVRIDNKVERVLQGVAKPLPARLM